MKVRNQYRPSKVQEIVRLKDKYEKMGHSLDEQLDGVLLELEEKVEKTKEFTQRASINELTKPFEQLFVDENGIPTAIGKYMMNLRLGRRRRVNEKLHPFEKYYKLVRIEIDARGVQIKRFYVAIISGKKEVAEVNERLETEKVRIEEIQNSNKDAEDVRAVRIARKKHLAELNTGRGAGIS